MSGHFYNHGGKFTRRGRLDLQPIRVITIGNGSKVKLFCDFHIYGGGNHAYNDYSAGYPDLPDRSVQITAKEGLFLYTEALDEMMEDVEIHLLSFGHGKHQKGKLFSMLFQDYDFWYIQRGSFMADINGKRYDMDTKDAILMSPGTNVTFQTKEYTELLYCHFAAESKEGESLQADFSNHRIPSVRQGLLQTFIHNFQGLYQDNEPDILSIRYLLKVILSDMLLSDTSNQIVMMPSHSFLKTKPLSPVMEFIHDNIDKPINNSMLASIAGFNENYFCRYFKKYIGIPPKQYVTKVKMEYARNLLVKDNLPVKEVAYRTGFSDPFTFSKQYKNYFFISPSKTKKLV